MFLGLGNHHFINCKSKTIFNVHNTIVCPPHGAQCNKKIKIPMPNIIQIYLKKIQGEKIGILHFSSKKYTRIKKYLLR